MTEQTGIVRYSTKDSLAQFFDLFQINFFQRLDAMTKIGGKAMNVLENFDYENENISLEEKKTLESIKKCDYNLSSLTKMIRNPILNSLLLYEFSDGKYFSIPEKIIVDISIDINTSKPISITVQMEGKDQQQKDLSDEKLDYYFKKMIHWMLGECFPETDSHAD